ncbi:MAG: hypothetical protein ACFNW2_10015, partial [Streptococcus sanguinis]
EFNDAGAIWSVNLNEAEFAELFKFYKEFEASEFKFLALPLGSKPFSRTNDFLVTKGLEPIDWLA